MRTCAMCSCMHCMYQSDDRTTRRSVCRVSPNDIVAAGCRVTWLRQTSSMRSIPHIAMAASNSVCSRCKRNDTASSPPTPSAKKTGFPIPTAEAPRARAFRTSVPRRIPPSIQTGTPLPRMASTTSGNTSNAERQPSNCRPPWFETMIPSAPAPTARMASSAVMMPLTTRGKNRPEPCRCCSRMSSRLIQETSSHETFCSNIRSLF
mmetsp:Transcript_24485/g.54612  ORF Transcript_24485/g.54612 Transcript_24485/m.54612 type:complete len:206 (-) Transcript_24485:784-1401(-)